MKKLQHKNRKDLWLTAFESVVTAAMLAIPIMTPFFIDIGLNQEQIALSQIIFTVVLMVLDIPLGWIADRFSRKWANVIGDLGCAVTLLLYATVQDFAGVVACEMLFGVFLAFSTGVDASLLKHFSGKIDGTGKLFKTMTARVAAWQFVCMLVVVSLGGPIGAIDFRLAIALSAVTYLAGGLAMLFLRDDSERLVPKHKNPLRDMARVVKEAAWNPRLRLRIFAYAVTREVTHGIIWVFTPLLLAAGVPLYIVSLGWAMDAAAGFVGSKIAQRYVHRLKEWQIVAIPMVAVVVSLGAMSISFNIVTVWLYLVMGLVQGWTSATMLPMVQQRVSAAEQTSVISVAKVVARFLYIPAVWLIGVAADMQTEYSLLATLVIFVPLSVPIVLKLKKEK